MACLVVCSIKLPNILKFYNSFIYDFTLFRFLCNRRSLTHTQQLARGNVHFFIPGFIYWMKKKRIKDELHVTHCNYIYFIFRTKILILIIILCMCLCVHEPFFVFNCARRRFITVNQKPPLKWNVVLEWTVFNLFIWMLNGL